MRTYSPFLVEVLPWSADPRSTATDHLSIDYALLPKPLALPSDVVRLSN
jgi:hypothetical protein